MVSPSWEGRGVARDLMRFVERHAVALGYRCMRLDTFCDNPRALRFYELGGYQRVGRVPGSHPNWT